MGIANKKAMPIQIANFLMSIIPYSQYIGAVGSALLASGFVRKE